MTAPAVTLYMAGTPDRPVSASSALAVQLLDQCRIGYDTFDIGVDMSARARAMSASSYRMFPQLFVNHEFIGGGEVVVELLRSEMLRAAHDLGGASGA